ncbi:methylenetetrahydrofolate dehydrogenase-like protein [Leptomonas pyrrhocoris]|uniref:Methylenetetrahydrofolate dehydrogenase-like protein n=1 Tax=Leptomonas pyrrhocoris TaxID=157538 RepID=A0A0N0DZS5_LEPPY|nr:methylenetetrahydrofolate dehydrogenase-like protein [Leptomonas pyrrhocoris]KPA85625.1 methylenetetrahydrofolate dehydrogenase-like protein [Leptomonas pyrrhocoris]|eukprot:XP_015664064.1 methylenetetrahydrofolate dehydrogenase-like protein [Leptomonas pyrrhocoris]
MPFFSTTRSRLRRAELLSGVPLSKEMRKRIHAVTLQLSRAPCLAVFLVGDRADSIRYVNHKKRAAAECGIEMRVVRLPSTVRQIELHKALAAVNGDVSVDGVILQLPLPPHLRARPALYHIHPGKDVDGLHPLNAGNLFLQDQSPLLHVITSNNSNGWEGAGASSSPSSSSALPCTDMAGPDHLADGLTDEVLLLPTASGGYNALHRRTHERKFFVPCTALAIRSILFSYLSRTESLSHLMRAVHEDDPAKPPSSPSLSSTPALAESHITNSSSKESKTKPQAAAVGREKPRDLHAVIVNKSMVVGVPTAALLHRAGGFVVTSCSRSNSLESVRCLARQADVLITAYGQASVFDASCVKPGAIIIDAAINELPQPPTTSHSTPAASPVRWVLCGDVDVASVSSVAAAVTKTPGGVGPLTVSHLMMNVLKAYRLRHANHIYYNNIYTEFLKMYGTYDKVRDYAPSAALVVRAPSAGSAATQTALSDREKLVKCPANDEDDLDDEDADNGSYEV